MGVDIKQISERLGHSSVKTTWDIYSHLYPDKDVELADKLNDIFQTEMRSRKSLMETKIDYRVEKISQNNLKTISKQSQRAL